MSSLRYSPAKVVPVLDNLCDTEMTHGVQLSYFSGHVLAQDV